MVRFAGSLQPVGPRAASERWALGQLEPGERSLFQSMSGPDRRHGIAVARRALDLTRASGMAPEALPDGFVAAALLHDVGKVDSRLGTFSRAWTTLVALALGRQRVLSWEGSTCSGPDRLACRMARYLRHDRIGAELISEAGGATLASKWAREHHLPEELWSVDRRLGRCLKDADGD